MYRVFPDNGSLGYLCTVGYVESVHQNTEGTVFMNQLYIIFDRNHVYFAFNMFVHTIFRSVARSSLPHFVCPSVRLSVRLSLTVMFFLHISYITQLGKVPTPNIMFGHMLEEDLQTYKCSLVRFRNINVSGSRINCGQIAALNP